MKEKIIPVEKKNLKKELLEKSVIPCLEVLIVAGTLALVDQMSHLQTNSGPKVFETALTLQKR